MRLLLDPRTGSPLTDEPLDGWRLQLRRSENGGGRPQVVRDQDGAVLLLPADAEEEDCHEYRREGWPHLVALGIRNGRQVVTRGVPQPLEEGEEGEEEELQEEELPGALETACADMMRANADAMRQMSAASVAQMKAVTESSLGLLDAVAQFLGRGGLESAEDKKPSTEERLMALGEQVVRIKGAEAAARLTAPAPAAPAPPLPPPPSKPKNGANGAHKRK